MTNVLHLLNDLESLKSAIADVDSYINESSHMLRAYKDYYVELPHINHYRLLAFLSRQLGEGLVFDIGTHCGASALALSCSPNVKVVSYDIRQHPQLFSPPSNIELLIGDVYKDDRLFEADIIFVDVDPHDGKWERNFCSHLADNNYKGLVLWDDVYIRESMTEFWDSITERKIDLTPVGHVTGTGLVIFE